MNTTWEATFPRMSSAPMKLGPVAAFSGTVNATARLPLASAAAASLARGPAKLTITVEPGTHPAPCMVTADPLGPEAGLIVSVGLVTVKVASWCHAPFVTVIMWFPFATGGINALKAVGSPVISTTGGTVVIGAPSNVTVNLLSRAKPVAVILTAAPTGPAVGSTATA